MTQIDPNAVYKLGPSGNLQQLPGIQSSESVPTDVDYNQVIHKTLAGKRVRDVLGPQKRTWKFRWQYLLLAEADAVKQIVDGDLGLPLLLEDPFSASGAVEVVLSKFSRSFVSPQEAHVELELLEV